MGRRPSWTGGWPLVEEVEVSPGPEADVVQRRLMDAARDAYIRIDAEGRVLAWNRHSEELFGWSCTEAEGAELAELIVPPELRDAHRTGLRRFATTGRGNVAFQRLRLPAVDSSGQRLEVEFTILPTRGPDDTWEFHSFLRDVSSERLSAGYVTLLQRAALAANDARSVEEAVRSVLAAIREVSHVRLAHAWLADGDDGTAVLRPTGWWMPAALEPFSEATLSTTFTPGRGLPGRVATSGAPAWISDLEQDADFPRAAAALEAGLRAAFAFPVMLADRVVAVIELFVKRPAEPDPQLLDVMATVGTQLGRVFERTRAMERLRELAEQRREIVSIVGHELSGPLGAVHLSVEMLSELGHDSIDPEMAELLATADRQLRRLRRLVRTLLTAQRLDAGSLLVEPRPTLLAAGVDETIADAQVAGVENRVPPDLRVVVDPDHLAQILWNLLTNAQRHGEPPIVVAADVERGAARLTVRDAGPGVAEEHQHTLFQRTARDPRSPGTGLGLSIVRGLAEANGGGATYVDEGGQGATFVVTLPTP